MTITTEQFVTIAVGTTANDGTGDILRDAFIKVNNNFANITDTGIVTANISVQGDIESIGNITTTDYFIGNVSGNLFGNIAKTCSIFGNINFSGTGRRIIGEFSAASPNDRVMFLTNATNGVTDVAVIPSGTATSTKLSLFNNTNASDASRLELECTATATSIKSSYEGVGTYLPFTIETSATEQIRVALDGNVTITGNTSINRQLAVTGKSFLNDTSLAGNVTVTSAYVPPGNTSPGTTGQIAWDINYIYICTATNSWKRANVAVW